MRMRNLVGGQLIDCYREISPEASEISCARESAPATEIGVGTCLREAAPVSAGPCLRESAPVSAGPCLREAVPVSAGFACVKEVVRELKPGDVLNCVKEVARPAVEAEGALACVKEVLKPEAMPGQPLDCVKEVQARRTGGPGEEIYCAREAAQKNRQ